jgi:hypothetical protein
MLGRDMVRNAISTAAKPRTTMVSVPALMGPMVVFALSNPATSMFFLEYQFTGQDITGAQQKKACPVFQQGMLFISVICFYTTQPLH